MPACANGHVDIVRLLLEARADVNAKDVEGTTALMLASGLGYAEVVTLLVQAGADLNAQDSLGRTALNLAQKDDVKKALAAGLNGEK